MGGGVYPCPNFLVLFFHQVIVPKKVIFYPKLTIFVGFSVIFVIIIIKITKILIKIIMATIIIIISIFFHHTRKTSFLSAGKKGPRCPNWGVGGGLANSGNARIKTFIFCWCLPLGKPSRENKGFNSGIARISSFFECMIKMKIKIKMMMKFFDDDG